jgi:hypothetical protein
MFFEMLNGRLPPALVQTPLLRAIVRRPSFGPNVKVKPLTFEPPDVTFPPVEPWRVKVEV